MGRLGIQIANVLLCALCCFQVAGLVNSVSGDLLMMEPTEALGSQQTADLRMAAWADREPILDRNLFGAKLYPKQPEPEPEPEPDLDLDQTRLPLTLIGTMLMGPPGFSSAVIGNKGRGKTEVRLEGDALEKHPKVTVAKIERGRVILQNGSRLEELRLTEDKGTKTITPPTRTARRSRRTSSPTPKKSNSLVDQLAELAASGGGLRDAKNLFNQAKIVPKWSAGEMTGVEVRDIEAGSLYEKVGLQDGDIITSFNGIKLDSTGAAAQVLSQLSEAEKFEIELSDGTIKALDPADLAELMAQ